MVYVSDLPTFPTSLIVASCAKWWSAAAISQLLATLSSAYFPAHASRETALAVFNSLAAAPFSIDTRFPVDSFVTDLDPYFSKLIGQIVGALSYSDRLLNKNGGPTSNDAAYIAAKSSFFTVIPILTAYIRDYNNYYDRAKFESHFQVSWQ